ncbi:MAG: 50S ribosomal protein L9 [Verrucomicrobiota bacterium]
MATTEVILREKITGLGAEADVVKVRRGYARNFLIPQGKAYEATRGNLRQLENLQALRAQREGEELREAERIATKVKRVKFELELQTGASGKAFGSITVIDLVSAIQEKTGEAVDRHAISLDKPIKSTGSFNIPVKLHQDVKFDLRLFVKSANDTEDSQES